MFNLPSYIICIIYLPLKTYRINLLSELVLIYQYSIFISYFTTYYYYYLIIFQSDGWCL